MKKHICIYLITGMVMFFCLPIVTCAQVSPYGPQIQESSSGAWVRSSDLVLPADDGQQPRLTATPSKAIDKLANTIRELLKNNNVKGAVAKLGKSTAGAAAQVLSMLTTDEQKTIIGAMTPAKAAAVLNKFVATGGVNEVSNIIGGLEVSKAAAILGSMASVHAANVVSKFGLDKKIELIGAMTPAQASGVLNSLVAAGGVNEVVNIIDSFGINKAAAILGSMDPVHAANVVSKFGLDKQIQLIGAMTPAQAAGVLNSLVAAGGVNEVVNIIDSFGINKAAAILGSMDLVHAANVVSKFGLAKQMHLISAMPTAKAAGILGSMDAGHAANLLNRFDLGKQINLISAMPAAQAAGILNKLVVAVGAYETAGIIKGLEVGKAAVILGNMNPIRAADIVSQCPLDKTIKLIGAMAPAKAAAVLNTLMASGGVEQATNIIRGLATGKAAGILGEMNPEHAAEIILKFGTFIKLPRDPYGREGDSYFADPFGRMESFFRNLDPAKGDQIMKHMVWNKSSALTCYKMLSDLHFLEPAAKYLYRDTKIAIISKTPGINLHLDL